MAESRSNLLALVKLLESVLLARLLAAQLEPQLEMLSALPLAIEWLDAQLVKQSETRLVLMFDIGNKLHTDYHEWCGGSHLEKSVTDNCL